MSKKRFISIILAACLLCAFSSAFAAEAGSAQDPLITKSFADGTYYNQVMNMAIKNLQDSLAALEFKLAQVSTGSAAKIKSLSTTAGGRITAASGASFTLHSGMAKLSNLRGVLIDVTEGKILTSGKNLTAGHRYVAGENTSVSIDATSVIKLSALGSVFVTAGTGMKFADVGSDAWFYDYVLYTVERGLVEGKSDISFAPDANLTFAETIKLAACMHQLYYDGKVTLVGGSDVWYSTYTNYALQNGIISKSPANYDAFISRDEFVSIFRAAMPDGEYKEINLVNDGAIPDVKMADSYASDIYCFYRAGILDGKDSKGSFMPKDKILRSEVTAVITRMFEKDQRMSITLQ